MANGVTAQLSCLVLCGSAHILNPAAWLPERHLSQSAGTAEPSRSLRKVVHVDCCGAACDVAEVPVGSKEMDLLDLI